MAQLATIPKTPRDKVKEGLALAKIGPYEMVQPMIDGLKRGMTLRGAARLSGISWAVLSLMLELGEEGHHAYVEIYMAVERARGTAILPTREKLKEQAEEGSHSARKEYLQSMEPDEFGAVYDTGERESSGQAQSFPGGIEIIYNKFAAAEEPALPVVDAELLEDNDGTD